MVGSLHDLLLNFCLMRIDVLFFSGDDRFACFIYFQDGLKRRMDKLRTSIQEASKDVDREREKNVSLLQLIFPPDIAKRLWLGMSLNFNTMHTY